MADPVSDQTGTNDELKQQLAALANPAVQKLYINGFALGTSLSDIYMVAQTAGTPSLVLLMSFTTAKTLAQNLGGLISEFERVTGQTLLTMADIQQATSKSSGEPKV